MRRPIGRALVAREIRRRLDEGTDEEADAADEGANAAWLIEIERRMADFDAGGDPGEEWSVVRDRILAGLRKPYGLRREESGASSAGPPPKSM